MVAVSTAHSRCALDGSTAHSRCALDGCIAHSKCALDGSIEHSRCALDSYLGETAEHGQELSANGDVQSLYPVFNSECTGQKYLSLTLGLHTVQVCTDSNGLCSNKSIKS